MLRLPVAIIATIGLGIAAALAAVLLAPEAGVAAILQAVGLALVGAVGIVGVVVTHGLWARRTTAATLAAGLLALVVTQVSLWWWLALVTGTTALYMTLGPPLDPWTRRLPPPEPLPPQTIALPLVLLATPYAAGLAGVEPAVAVAWSVVAGGAAWVFSRARASGLWVARVAVPVAGVAAALTAEPAWAGIGIAGFVATTAWLAWSKPAMLAVAPLDPRQIHPRPVFAELAPEEVRKAAGIDRKGRRI